MKLDQIGKAKPWVPIKSPDNLSDVHVMPLGDDMAHVFDDCNCGPREEEVPDDEGYIKGYIHVHHSLDGREAWEDDAGYMRSQWFKQSVMFMYLAIMHPHNPRGRFAEIRETFAAIRKNAVVAFAKDN